MKSPMQFVIAPLCAFRLRVPDRIFPIFQIRKYLPAPLAGAAAFLRASPVELTADAQLLARPSIAPIRHCCISGILRP